MIEQPDFNVGDPVIITAGQHKGKTGKIARKCSSVFNDWIYVLLDLRKRERVPKKIMIEKKYLIESHES